MAKAAAAADKEMKMKTSNPLYELRLSLIGTNDCNVSEV
jgi:hypothetical protein